MCLLCAHGPCRSCWGKGQLALFGKAGGSDVLSGTVKVSVGSFQEQTCSPYFLVTDFQVPVHSV